MSRNMGPSSGHKGSRQMRPPHMDRGPEELTYPVDIDALSHFMEEPAPARRTTPKRPPAPAPDAGAIADALKYYSSELDAIQQTAGVNNSFLQRPHLASREHPHPFPAQGYDILKQQNHYAGQHVAERSRLPDMAEQRFYEQRDNISGPVAIEPHHFKLSAPRSSSPPQSLQGNAFTSQKPPFAMPHEKSSGQLRNSSVPSQSYVSNLSGSGTPDFGSLPRQDLPKRVKSMILGGLAGDGGGAQKKTFPQSQPLSPATEAKDNGGLSQRGPSKVGFSEGYHTGTKTFSTPGMTSSEQNKTGYTSSSPSSMQPQMGQGSQPGFSPIWKTDHISPAARAYRDSHLLGIQSPQIKLEQERPARPLSSSGQIYPEQIYDGQRYGGQTGGGSNSFFSQSVAYEDNPFSYPEYTPLSASSSQPSASEKGPSFLSRKRHRTEHQAASHSEERMKPRKLRLSQDDKRKRRAIKAYFGSRPLWTVIPIFAGMAGIFSQVERDIFVRGSWLGYRLDYGWEFLISLLVLLFGLAWRYIIFSRPREDLLDEWIEQDLKRLESRAIDILDTDKRGVLVDPIVLVGFPDVDALGGTFRRGLFGRDHVLRYTPRAVTILCFTLDEIIAYEGALDLTTGERVYETTREFFYKDIATIGVVKTTVGSGWHSLTRISSVLLPWKWGFVEAVMGILSGRGRGQAVSTNAKEFFQISLMDGTSIKLVLRDGRMVSEAHSEEIPFTTDDKVIRAIKDFVIARKNDQMALSRR